MTVRLEAAAYLVTKQQKGSGMRKLFIFGAAALIALSGGGHAVELIVEGGTQLIGVQLGDFVDDLVEISGDVQPGDRVAMAGR